MPFGVLVRKHVLIIWFANHLTLSVPELRLLLKYVVHTNLDIYDFITICFEVLKRDKRCHMSWFF
jgi:hypothetical protein